MPRLKGAKERDYALEARRAAKNCTCRPWEKYPMMVAYKRLEKERFVELKCFQCGKRFVIENALFEYSKYGLTNLCRHPFHVGR
jgi:hypothetical protein